MAKDTQHYVAPDVRAGVKTHIQTYDPANNIISVLPNWYLVDSDMHLRKSAM